MTNYLDRIGAGLILANPEVFNFDYVPEHMVGRGEIQNELASKFTTLHLPEGSGRVVITGPVGSGKTALAQTFCRDIQRHLLNKRNIRSVHVNCRNASTSMRVVQRILHELAPGHPDRGLSMGELLMSLRRILRKETSHLIVVLDEVDHMLRRSGDDLLYQLLRIDEDQNGKGTLSLILVSQEQVLDMLETAVISRMGSTNHLRITPYDVDGLEAIATQRASRGLVPGTWTPEIIRLVAEKAAPTGDARRVIELLNAAVERCEFRQDGHSERRLTVEDIHLPLTNEPTTVGSNLEHIDDLNANAMLVLLALCRRLTKQESMTTGDVEQLYAVVCEEYEQKMKSHTTVWKYLKDFEERQIISSRVAAITGGRGRTTHLSMPHYLPKDLASRLEMLLKKEF
ncbi:MAG: AAA family ATPase [Candidatus Poseidoniaceae archaeon]|nr:AAA family ATPase [Candidatus Poseidoniaceae archaeon]